MPPPDPFLEPPSPRRTIVVLGMHRSGTSAVAGTLQRLGVDFGPRLMPPTPDNARGFYEHIDIVNLHDRLLLSTGSSWDDTQPRSPDWLDEARTARFRDDLREILRRDFGSAPLWGLKDPRLCRLLPWWHPLWAELAAEPFFVIVLRDPREVTASLARRDGFSPGKAYLLWLQHILEVERETRSCQRLFLDFADFLGDWRLALAPLGSFLGAAWPAGPAVPVAADDEFVSSALPRAHRSPATGAVPVWVETVDAALRREKQTGTALFKVLDGVAAQLEAAQTLYGGAADRADDLSRQLAASQQQAQWYEAEWQKARRRLKQSQEKSEKHRQYALSLKNRILDKEAIQSKVRKQTNSDLRKPLGWWRRFFPSF